MKDKKFIIITVIIIIVLAIFPYFLGNILFNEPTYKLICQSTSPKKSYTINAYEVNAGATVDYTVEAYLMKDGKKNKLIYLQYHEREAKIKWLNNEVVIINDITLDLSQNETYDWRKNNTGDG